MTVKPTYEELERRVQELEKIESELEYSKEMLQVYEKSSLGYQSLDENGHYITVNQNWLDTLGYDKEEVIGKSFADFIHPDWRHHFKENFPRFKSIGEILGAEFEMVKKNGDLILVSLTGNISRDKKGDFQQTHCIFHDITEYKQAEKVRKASEHKFRIIANYTYDWEGWHNNKGSLLWVNPAVERMTGRTTEECLAMREYPLPLIHPEDRHVFETLKVQALAGKSGNDIPFRIVREDHSASATWAAVSWNPVLDDRGTPDGYRTSIRDITDRKRMEKDLRESEEKYRILFEHTGEALFVAQDGKIVFQNPRSIELSGYSAEEFQSKPFFYFIHEDDRKMVTGHHLRRLKNEKLPKRYAFRIIHKNGSILWAELNAVLIQWNRKPAVLCFMTDITERKQAEEDLRNERAVLKAIIDSIPVMITRYDPHNKMLFLNKELEKKIGWKTEQLCKIDLMEKVYPDPAYRKLVQEYMEKTAVEWREFLLRTKSDETIISEWSNICLDDGTRIGIGFDVTDRRQKEEEAVALKESLDLVACFGFTKDLDLKYVGANRSFCDLLQIPNNEIKGMTDFDIFPTDLAEKYIADDKRVIDTAKPLTVEEVTINSNTNQRFIVQTRKFPRFDKNGNVTGLYGMGYDVTELKQAEYALRESQEKLQALFSAMAEMVVLHKLVFDDKGMPCNYRILDCNQAFCQITKFKKEDVVGKTATELFKTESPPYLDVYAKVALSAEPAEFYIYDVPMERHFLVSAVSPRKHFFATITSDITEIKLAEAEREKLQAQLNQAQKLESVGRLAGGVAHDFNNMLGIILGHTELALLQVDENHDLHDDLNQIQKAAKRSADITKQLLAFARKQTISPKQLNLNDTVESMLNMLRRLIGEDIDLVWKPDAYIWPVKMDPSQIDQVLVNLCINSKDAIAGVGKLTIETGRKTFDEDYCSEHQGFFPGDFVMLAVSDNGCGMDEHTLDNLFEPFFTTKDVGKGTGLGLATVYGIVKQNNGFINVYSESGQGSTFNIYLPRLVAEENTDKAIPEKKAAAGGTETILLVEDEPTILRMTSMMLERKGYTVLSAGTPIEAIDLAKNHANKIHLLMTDVVMPEMNGRDLAAKVTALHPDIRLLFMSGYTKDVIAHQGVLDAGVAFIQKPFSMTDMTEKVRNVLDMA